MQKHIVIEMDDHIPVESNDEEIALPAADMAAPAPAPAAAEKLPISKKQMKKLAKMERIKEYKAERKEKEKLAKKEEVRVHGRLILKYCRDWQCGL